MKKIIILFFTALIVLTFLSACQRSDIDNGDANINTSNNSTSTSLSDKVVETTTIKESLTEKLIREIDVAYHEEQKNPDNSTTIGMVELSDKYTEKWKQVADSYYNKIMEFDGIVQLSENNYSSDDLHIFVSNMKTNWEEYNQEQCANYVKTLQTIYGSGTIVGPIFADYKYEMQKDWALQLVGIYQQLYLEEN